MYKVIVNFVDGDISFSLYFSPSFHLSFVWPIKFFIRSNL